MFYHYDHQPRNRIRIKCSLGFSGRRTGRNDDDRGYYRSRFNLRTDAPLDSLGIGGVGRHTDDGWKDMLKTIKKGSGRGEKIKV